MTVPDGSLRADDGGKRASAKRAHAYLDRAFGAALSQVRAAMEILAASLPPDELNRVAFRLYERFRPKVVAGAGGWGAKGELHIERITNLANARQGVPAA